MAETEPTIKVSGVTWTPGSPARRIGPEAANRAARDPAAVTWVHVQALDSPEARRLLIDDFGFHPIAADDALTEHDRPTLVQGAESLFLTIPTLEENPRGFRYVHVGCSLNGSALVTVSVRPSKVVEEWMARWEAHPDQVALNAPLLLYALADAAVDDYFPAIDRVQMMVETLEDNVFKGTRAQPGDALRIKRKLVEMRRQVSPLRDVLNSLLRRDVVLIPEHVRMYFQDVYDHSLRVVENIDLNRDILSTIMDAQLNVVSNRLNETMRFMAAWATVLMSMALIAGIYGMNFEVMPELQWAAGYPFALALMVMAGGGWLWYFRRRGWLGLAGGGSRRDRKADPPTNEGGSAQGSHRSEP